MDNNLYVISVISNPVHYDSRYRLYNEFAARMAKHDVKLTTVELAMGARPHEITSPANPDHIQLRATDELWHKENMINIGISKLPPSWQYVAWIDADITFCNPAWVEETIHQLQYYPVVQMFQTAMDLGPTGEALTISSGFSWCYRKGEEPGNSYGKPYWHSGYAWAANRDAIDSLGGLIDFSLLGAADHHMAHALIGTPEKSIPKAIHSNYSDSVMRWAANAARHIKGNISYVEGSIVHHWHGKKRDRRYNDRWKILTDHGFDPINDLKRDWQGLYKLVDDGSARIRNLKKGIHNYFRARNEDSIDLE